MTTRLLVDVERVVVRGSAVSPARVERIMQRVEDRLRAAPLPDPGSGAAVGKTIPRISIRSTDDDETIARVLADELLEAIRGAGGGDG